MATSMGVFNTPVGQSHVKAVFIDTNMIPNWYSHDTNYLVVRDFSATAVFQAKC